MIQQFHSVVASRRAVGPSWDYEEYFENPAGYDLGMPPWSENLTPNPNFTAPSGMSGLCLRLDTNNQRSDLAVTPSKTYEIEFLWRHEGGLSDGSELFRFRDSGTTQIAAIRTRSDNRIQAFPQGGTGVLGSFVLAPNTTYKIWATVAVGTGADTSLTVWVDLPTNPKPGTPDCESTDGTATVDIESHQLRVAGAGKVYYYDDFKARVF